jgi:hypothetical protein
MDGFLSWFPEIVMKFSKADASCHEDLLPIYREARVGQVSRNV